MIVVIGVIALVMLIAITSLHVHHEFEHLLLLNVRLCIIRTHIAEFLISEIRSVRPFRFKLQAKITSDDFFSTFLVKIGPTAKLVVLRASGIFAFGVRIFALFEYNFVIIHGYFVVVLLVLALRESNDIGGHHRLEIGHQTHREIQCFELVRL